MATKEMKVCDVYGTTKNVEPHTITIVAGEEDGARIISCYDVDLCPRGFARLLKFIDRGTKPTTPLSRRRQWQRKQYATGARTVGTT